MTSWITVPVTLSDGRVARLPGTLYTALDRPDAQGLAEPGGCVSSPTGPRRACGR